MEMFEHAMTSIDEGQLGCPFDAASALERLDGDVELFDTLIEVFRQDSIELFAQLSVSLAAGNLREAERAAHSLKGLAANFDARQATEAALRIEEAARSRVVAGIEPRVKELGRLLEELRTALDGWNA
jgi:two-component system, sensor histidine kinase and response regulator